MKVGDLVGVIHNGHKTTHKGIVESVYHHRPSGQVCLTVTDSSDPEGWPFYDTEDHFFLITKLEDIEAYDPDTFRRKK